MVLYRSGLGEVSLILWFGFVWFNVICTFLVIADVSGMIWV